MKALWIAQVTAKAWLRGTAHQLGISPAGMTRLAAFLMICAIANALLLASMLGFTNGTNDISIATIVVISTSVSLTSSLVAVLFAMLLPPRTSLQLTLKLLPASRKAATLGGYTPVLLMASFVTSIAVLPVLVYVWVVTPLSDALVTSALLGALSIIMMLTFLSLYTIVREAAAQVFGLAPHFANSVSGFISIGVALLNSWVDYSTVLTHKVNLSSEDLSSTVSGAFSVLLLSLRQGRVDSAALFVALAWCLAAGILIAIALGVSSDCMSTAQIHTRRSFHVPQSSLLARSTIEAIQLLRSSQAMVLGVLVLAAAITQCVIFIFSTKSITIYALRVTAEMTLMAPFFIGVYSFGITRPSHWVGDLASGSRQHWIWPKLAGTLIASFTLFLPLATGMALVRLVDVLAVLELLPKAAVFWVSSVLAGTVLPHSTEQPLSSTVTNAAATAFLLIGTVGTAWLVHTLELPDSFAWNAFPVTLGVVAYFLVSRRLSSSETR